MNNSVFERPALLAVVLLLAVAGLLTPLLLLEMPENTRLWQALFNAGHAPLFGAIALLFLGLSLILIGDHFSRRFWHYLQALAAAILLGFGTEIAQMFNGRDAELGDVLTDVIGAVAVLGITMTFDRPLFRFQRIPPGWTIRTLRVCLFVLLISPLGSVAVWAAAYDKRDNMVPYLWRFDTYLGDQFMRTETADLEIVPPPVGWGNPNDTRIGRLTFHKTLYPQVYIDEVYPDWRGYDTLWIDILLPEADSARLTLRINDWPHNQEYTDRYNHTFWIRHGFTRLAFPLSVIASAPTGRPMQMDRIKTVILFSPEPPDSFSVYVGPLLLAR